VDGKGLGVKWLGWTGAVRFAPGASPAAPLFWASATEYFEKGDVRGREYLKVGISFCKGGQYFYIVIKTTRNHLAYKQC
jgi:hypothetical protein